MDKSYTIWSISNDTWGSWVAGIPLFFKPTSTDLPLCSPPHLLRVLTSDHHRLEKAKEKCEIDRINMTINLIIRWWYTYLTLAQLFILHRCWISNCENLIPSRIMLSKPETGSYNGPSLKSIAAVSHVAVMPFEERPMHTYSTEVILHRGGWKICNSKVIR